MDGTEIQTRQLAHRSRRHDVHGDPGDRVRTEKAPVRALFFTDPADAEGLEETARILGESVCWD